MTHATLLGGERDAEARPHEEALRLQLVFLCSVALVLGVMTLVSPAVWAGPWMPIGGGVLLVATALAAALAVGRERPAHWLAAVPLLDLAAVVALLGADDVPRILALLAVYPSFWLGFSARGRGIAVVGVAAAIVAAGMVARVATTAGVTLTANAVGAVLVPLSLVGAAWLALRTVRRVERQQAVLLQREQERGALLGRSAVDGALLDAIFETVRIGLVLLDPDGRVERMNPTLARHPAMAGETPEGAMADAVFLDLESREPIERSSTPFIRAARGESFDNAVQWAHRPGQDMLAITVSSRPLIVDGAFRGSIVAVDDVTTYMRMLADRDDFVALVSHELRTPLTSIAGYVELVLEEELPERIADWLQTVRRNSTRLQGLVEDLLIVGEMTRGELRLARASVDLRAVAEETVALLEHRARRRDVHLRLLPGPGVPVDADPRRIAQVAENLVSNAIKYVEEGGSIEVLVEGDAERATVSVVDDGPGVAPEEAARVFERFYRSPDARASGVQGAGLGLWICSMIMRAHGGSIRFDSTPGVGSTASFSLPR